MSVKQMPAVSLPLRAFRVECRDVPEGTAIVSACTHAQAKYTSYSGAWDAGYKLPFSGFRAVRAPEYDELMSKQKPRTCWSLDYAQSKLA